MIKIGLTGSIGMGKSTVAAMFEALGAPVWSADAAVHRLYEKGGAASGPVAAAFPGAVKDGAVDRKKLGEKVLGDAQALRRLEAIVHPLVVQDRREFIENAEKAGAAAAVFDIPLLFETGGEKTVDIVVVVSAPEAVQRARALARPGMTQEKFAAILAEQTPDGEKRRRADFIVDTSGSLEQTRAEVADVYKAILGSKGPGIRD